MLLDHPNSKFIFAAAELIELVWEIAKKMTILPAKGRFELLGESEQAFHGLRKLNAEHFGASVDILESINELERRLRVLAELAAVERKNEETCFCGFPRETRSYCSQCLDEIFPALLRIESLEMGFGTNMI